MNREKADRQSLVNSVVEMYAETNNWWRVASLFASVSLVGGAYLHFLPHFASYGFPAKAIFFSFCVFMSLMVLFFCIKYLPLLLTVLRDYLYSLPLASYSCKLTLISVIIIAVCWSVVLLAGWPGFFNYDAGMGGLMQWRQITDGVYNDHHPILHTLWIEYTVKAGRRLFGSINGGIFLSVVLQAAILLAIFGWAIADTLKQGISRVGYVVLVGYFALNPVIALFAFSTTKDVFASAAVLLVVLSIRSSLRGNSGNRGWHVLLIMASSIACIMRSNVLIAFLLYAVYLLFSRVSTKRLLGLLLIEGVVLAIAWSMVSTVVFNVQKSPIGLWNALGIPMQCVARVYNDQETAEKDRGLIRDVTGPIKYKVNQSDIARNSILDHETTKVDFMMIFLRMLPRYPLTYLEAVLLHTEDSWNAFSTINAYNTDGDGKTTVFEFVTKDPGAMHTKLPFVADFYRWISGVEGPEKVPFLGQLLSIPFYIFILLCCMASMKDAGNIAGLCAVTPLLLITLTNMVGPCMLLRYFLYDVYALPFAAIWVVGNDWEGHAR